MIILKFYKVELKIILAVDILYLVLKLITLEDTTYAI